MSEDQKYYCPSIEEFHPGFEYEILDKTNEVRERVFYPHDGADIADIETLIKHGCIRIPYLTGEQIVEAGWEDGGHGSADIRRFIFPGTPYAIMTNRNNEFVFEMRGNRETFGFQVHIKSKSDLLKLMEWVGIQKGDPGK